MTLNLPKVYSPKIEGISQSLLKDYMICPRRFVLAANRYAQPETKNLVFGTFFHALLEIHYMEHRPLEKGDAAAFTDAYDFPKTITAEDAEYMRAVGYVLYEAYAARYRDDFKYAIIPEHVFDVKADGGYRLRGKMDGIWKAAPDVWLLETKTKSQIGEEGLQKRLALDWQSLFYMLAYWYENKKMPRGVIYNVVRFPQRSVAGGYPAFTAALRKDIAAKPDYYFMRWNTEFTMDDIGKFAKELIAKLNELAARKVWYRNECSCDVYGGCPFVNYCATGSLDGLRRKSKLFEELK